jgi:hypothetical protein
MISALLNFILVILIGFVILNYLLIALIAVLSIELAAQFALSKLFKRRPS